MAKEQLWSTTHHGRIKLKNGKIVKDNMIGYSRSTVVSGKQVTTGTRKK